MRRFPSVSAATARRSRRAKYAGLAIDMALSRGGDQAVIKNRYSFEFFGGLSEEVEKRTKVKSRVVANALSQLIRDSSQVSSWVTRTATWTPSALRQAWSAPRASRTSRYISL
ncbi:MAG: hypothetical protein ACLR4Z_03030 [Butyricicoccaceae bacterium]